MGLVMGIFGCAGAPPETLGLRDGRLAACPSSPNCVSSEAADAAHAVAPLIPAVPPAQAFALAIEALSALPRTTLVTRTQDYAHAECRSALLGFVDDVELHLRDGRIAIRSASRVGYSDLGVNRRRVERLRAALVARAAVRAARGGSGPDGPGGPPGPAGGG